MTDFTNYHFSEEARIVSESIPGERSRELIQQQIELEGSVVSYPRSIPIALKRAKGAIVEDVDGNQFIDFFAGAGVLNVGHSNEEVMAYAVEQQKHLVHALDFPTENKLSAIRKILGCLPEALRDQYKVSFGGPTGSDAIEAAIKLAKIKTGRDTIIAFTGGYHGMTSGALALTSNVGFRSKLPSLIPNVHYVPYSYCYRCAFKQKPGACQNQCVDYLRQVLENSHSGVPKPAAIIIEPIQGEGGNIVPPEGYLEDLVRLAHQHDVLVIFDEIQSGFFRSGEFLSWMHTDAVPDIIAISKGLGGVGFPISGLIYRKDVEAWGPGAHIGTFRGNQVSLAAANGAFDFIERHDVRQHTKEMGAYLMERLETLKADCPYLGQVRGRGLMIGMEFVRDADTKEPFPSFVKAFRAACLQRGLLFEVGGHYNNVVRLVPPLIITPAIVDAAVDIMRDALTFLLATEPEFARADQSLTLA
ncbi:aspartate aminotransferase family protein [Hymenobacter sp. B81]|uniref:aspartate aminotransferase family protein n=1 Tax=Hymenobacter sp. B81 TaxID=3344878 RepID=UPI0037DC1B39